MKLIVLCKMLDHILKNSVFLRGKICLHCLQNTMYVLFLSIMDLYIKKVRIELGKARSNSWIFRSYHERKCINIFAVRHWSFLVYLNILEELYLFTNFFGSNSFWLRFIQTKKQISSKDHSCSDLPKIDPILDSTS